jgi:hypothetical protein
MSHRPTLTVIEAGERVRQQVLVNHLTELRLAAFVEHYAATAQTAAQANWSHEHYLAVLTEQEVDRRSQNRRKRRIQEARFPILKELADFDFAAIPHLNQAHILELARGRYLHDATNIILVGVPGLGNAHCHCFRRCCLPTRSSCALLHRRRVKQRTPSGAARTSSESLPRPGTAP